MLTNARKDHLLPLLKNPDWLEANQQAIYKNGEQIQVAVREGLELGASELQVQHSNHLAMLPPVD